MTDRTLVILSGGLDSTVALALEVDKGRDVSTLTFNYGQRHAREIGAAIDIASFYRKRTGGRVTARVFLMPEFGEAVRSSQTDGMIDVPKGHYEAESMKETVVPGRNLVMLAIAAGIAESEGCNRLVIGVHGGDHAIYPDCRPSFMAAAAEAIRQGQYEPPKVSAPFITLKKHEIVTIGAGFDVPFAMTYSCYEGQPKHCGECGTCVERQEAFKLAGVPDPTPYYQHRWSPV